jgi:gamma-glutamyl:cysteine ligase YbdK (ATP-grasp superfamily)
MSIAPTGKPKIGLEIEGAVICADTLDVTGAVDLVTKVRLQSTVGRVHSELNSESIELAVAPTSSASLLEANARACLAALVEELNLSQRMVCFTGLFPSDRYTFNRKPAVVRLEEIYGRAIYDAFTGCHGIHLHRHCGTGDVSIAVYNAVRCIVPAFIAMTANSPLSLTGKYRGLCSERLIARRQAPLSGPAPRATHRTIEGYRLWQDEKIRLGVFEGPSATHYDVRPLRFDLGTVELIALDACEDPAMWIAVADLYDCFCEAVAIHHTSGTELPAWLYDLDDETLAFNRHMAIRDGTKAVILLPDRPSEEGRVPMRAYIDKILWFLSVSGKSVCRNTYEVLSDTLNNGCPAEIKLRRIERLLGKSRIEFLGKLIPFEVTRRVFTNFTTYA